MQVVKLDSGYISGTVLGEPDKLVYVYRGIPYAVPPVGDLRWKPPQPVTPWSGIRECTAFGAVAPQFTGALTVNKLQSEDCLYLNVLSPAKSATDSLPVMVWIHGGGFTDGTGNDEMYNGTPLPSHGVVLVTVNTRLGVFGCLSHPLLSKESIYGVSGNYIFLDLLAALKWVQQNIVAFGGDPKRVTIFGESGGSAKVINLMASPLAKGLFQRAIGQSGGRGGGIPIKEMENVGERLFSKLGIGSETDQLAAVRALPWTKINEAAKGITAEMKMPMGPWEPTIDGWFLPESPERIFSEGKHNNVPLIMGSNLGELTGPGMIVVPQWIQGYVSFFKGANKIGGKTFAYIFDRVPAGWKNEGSVCTHAMQLPYLFGDMNWKGVIWGVLFWIAKSAGAKNNDPGLDNLDNETSKIVMQLWTNFAKTGNPSIPGIIDWPAWDEEKDQYLYITEKPEVRSGFSKVGQK
jgi:para-nitrobenzyl esterase